MGKLQCTLVFAECIQHHEISITISCSSTVFGLLEYPTCFWYALLWALYHSLWVPFPLVTLHVFWHTHNCASVCYAHCAVNICPEDGVVDRTCFNEAQAYVFSILENRWNITLLLESHICHTCMFPYPSYYCAWPIQEEKLSFHSLSTHTTVSCW